jgi:hypothetical protein
MVKFIKRAVIFSIACVFCVSCGTASKPDGSVIPNAGITVDASPDAGYNWALSIEYDFIWSAADGSILAQRDGVKYSVSPDFDLIPAPQEILDTEFAADGLTVFEEDGKFGFVDAHGNIAVDTIYELVLPFSDGLAAVCDGRQFWFVDTSGNTVLGPYEYLGAEVMTKNHAYMAFSEGLTAYYEINGEVWGYMNKQGEIVILAEYSRVRPFSEGLASVAFKAPAKGGAYIDAEGKIVFDIGGSDFKNGFALRYDGIVINRQGEDVFEIPPEYEPEAYYINEDEYFSNGLIVVYQKESSAPVKNRRVGVLSIAGDTVVRPEFDNARIVGDRFVAVQDGDLWGLIRI